MTRARYVASSEPGILENFSDRQAVSRLRQMRLEKRKPASSIGVFEAVLTALNAYRDAHPDTTYEHMLEGLRGALTAVEATQEESRRGGAK